MDGDATADTFAVLFGFWLAVFGCSQASEPPDESSPSDAGIACEERPDTGTVGQASIDFVPESLCQLVKRADRLGGVYVVEGLADNTCGYHVELTLKSGWGTDPIGDTTITFGQSELGNSGFFIPELSVGETVVILFERDGDGGYRFRDDMTFHHTGMGYTNGELFADDPVSVETLKTKVMDLYRGVQSGEGCPYNVKPPGWENWHHMDAATGGQDTDAGS